MRVLLISHTCCSKAAGQPKAVELGSIPGIELCLVVPKRWKAYGKWASHEGPLGDNYQYQALRPRLAWAGPAQTYLHHYPGLSKVLKSFQPDVIDLWEEPWSMVSLQVTRLRNRLCPNALVVSETEQNIDKRLPPPFEQVRGFVLSRADGLVARSTQALDVARRKGFSREGRVIGNAYDPEVFRPLDRAKCRAECGWNGKVPVVGYVGRLVESKGIRSLIKAVAKIDGVRLILIGDGPDGSSFKQQAAGLGIADRVSFVPHVPADELPRWMNALDMLVLPSLTTASWKEQFGRVLIEAMACETPVIGSDSGAIPEVIGEAGRIFPEGNSGQLASHINELSNNKALLQGMGKRGKARVASRYSWRRVAEQYYELYQSLTQAKAAGHQTCQTSA